MKLDGITRGNERGQREGGGLKRSLVGVEKGEVINDERKKEKLL